MLNIHEMVRTGTLPHPPLHADGKVFLEKDSRNLPYTQGPGAVTGGDRRSVSTVELRADPCCGYIPRVPCRTLAREAVRRGPGVRPGPGLRPWAPRWNEEQGLS